jgi:hypothetical protein
MNRKRATTVILIIIFIVSSGIIISSCKKAPADELIIFTQVTGNEPGKNDQPGNTHAEESSARIVAIDPGKPDGSFRVLTEGYYSALSPEISCDAKTLLFAAKQNQNDIRQICEMNLENMNIRRITSSSQDCSDPVYLSDGRIAFSQNNETETLKSKLTLYTCNPDGSDVKRITFSPASYYSSTILNDGRIMSVTSQHTPSPVNTFFTVLRPDGTKAELFYRGMKGTSIKTRGFETTDGHLVFIESDENNVKGGKITSIKYNRPLHSSIDLTSGIKGDFRAVFPLKSGKLLVSYRPSESDRYSLYEYDPDKKTLGNSIYNDKNYDVSQVVVTAKHEKPKKLPSEVDMGVKTGLLLCQDIKVSDPVSSDFISSLSKASAIEVIGIDSSMGIVKVENDGSFYLKVMADKPFQIRTLDDEGRTLNITCDWMWLRPNERRGCVGCHEDPEQVPDNRVPRAVKNLPVNIPVHINKVKEKKVSLE